MDVEQNTTSHSHQLPEHTVDDTQHKESSSLIVILVLVLVGIGGGIYTGIRIASNDVNRIDEERHIPLKERGIQVDASRFDVDGTLYLSLVLRDKSDVLDIYSYDFFSGKLKREEELPPGLNITAAVAPNKNQFAFMRYPSGEENMQVYLADVEGKVIRKITDDNKKYKREPRWSPDGSLIAYIVQTDDPRDDTHLPEGWRIYITDLEGNEELVAIGYNPIWSPTGRELLILKNDGLYMYSLDTKSIKKVWEDHTGGNIHSHMKLAVSHDGKMLSWSDHHASDGKGIVYLFDIISWLPFDMKLQEKLHKFAVYTLFSPNDKYLAMEIEIGSGKSFIELLNLETFDSQRILDLSGYNVSFLWMSDWAPSL